MKKLPINTIHIQGWKSIRDVEIDFDKINIFIGANGAGKSSFLSIFKILRALGNNSIISYIGKIGGANANFHYGTKTTDTVKITLESGDIEFECELLATNSDSIIGRAVHTNELGRDFLKSLILYHFHDTGDTSPLKRTCDIHENRYLFPDGANLAATLYKIQQESPEHYDKILFTINLIFPEFKDFIFNRTDDFLNLRWQDKNNIDYTFPISSLSDGTLRFIALTTLLMQPEPPEVIIIDEPELGLHPQAISILAELIKLASATSQIIISTQSVDLINCFEPEDILITENQHGETIIKRQNPEELKEWLEDYTLGDLWRKNLMGGNP